MGLSKGRWALRALAKEAFFTLYYWAEMPLSSSLAQDASLSSWKSRVRIPLGAPSFFSTRASPAQLQEGRSLMQRVEGSLPAKTTWKARPKRPGKAPGPPRTRGIISRNQMSSFLHRCAFAAGDHLQHPLKDLRCKHVAVRPTHDEGGALDSFQASPQGLGGPTLGSEVGTSDSTVILPRPTAVGHFSNGVLQAAVDQPGGTPRVFHGPARRILRSCLIGRGEI